MKVTGFQTGNKYGASNKGRKPKPQQGFQKGNALHEHPKAVATRFQKGHIMSAEDREKVAQANRGPNNYLWKGGRRTLNKVIRDSWYYRDWRKRVFERDDYTCQGCGDRGCYLEAHHTPKTYSGILDEYQIQTLEQAVNCRDLWEVGNGQTLCWDCHNLTK